MEPSAYSLSLVKRVRGSSRYRYLLVRVLRSLRCSSSVIRRDVRLPLLWAYTTRHRSANNIKPNVLLSLDNSQPADMPQIHPKNALGDISLLYAAVRATEAEGGNRQTGRFRLDDAALASAGRISRLFMRVADAAITATGNPHWACA